MSAGITEEQIQNQSSFFACFSRRIDEQSTKKLFDMAQNLFTASELLADRIYYLKENPEANKKAIEAQIDICTGFFNDLANIMNTVDVSATMEIKSDPYNHSNQQKIKTTSLHLAVGINFSKPTTKYQNLEILKTQFQQSQLVKQLAEHRTAKLNQKNSEGCTPLHIAAKANNLENIAILIKNGADPFIKNAEGKTALALATDRHCQQYLKIAQNYQQLKNILKNRYSLGIMGTFLLTGLTLAILKEAKPSGLVVDMLGDKALLGLDAWQMTAIGIFFLSTTVMLIAKAYIYHKQNKIIEADTAQLNAAALAT